MHIHTIYTHTQTNTHTQTPTSTHTGTDKHTYTNTHPANQLIDRYKNTQSKLHVKDKQIHETSNRKVNRNTRRETDT